MSDAPDEVPEDQGEEEAQGEAITLEIQDSVLGSGSEIIYED